MLRFITAGLLALSACTAPVAAQNSLPNCNTYEHAQNLLTERFNEYPVFQGLLADNSGIVELWLNPLTRTWTILVLSPDRQACLVAEGFVFEQPEAPIPGDDM